MTHECTSGVECHHTVEDLNPKSHAVKHLEMTIKRAIKLIDLWDIELVDRRWGGVKKDWTDVSPEKYTRILGERFAWRTDSVIAELYARYKSKALHGQVLDLYKQLPEATKKGLRSDVNRIYKIVGG